MRIKIDNDMHIHTYISANYHGQRDEDNYFECPNGDYILDDFYKLVRNRDGTFGGAFACAVILNAVCRTYTNAGYCRNFICGCL